jgi:DNA-binding NtrC family response regulator
VPPPAVETPAPPEAVHEGTPQATLLDHKQRLIESTLAACGGNIAKAARALGVSRGMLYRRLQKVGSLDASADRASAKT